MPRINSFTYLLAYLLKTARVSKEYRLTTRRVASFAVRCRRWRTNCTRRSTCCDNCEDAGSTMRIQRRSATLQTPTTQWVWTPAGNDLPPTRNERTALCDIFR